MGTELWPGGPKIANAPGVFPVGTDAVLLADFARRPGRRRLLDLGCGSGLLMLLLAHWLPDLEALGLDISAQAAALAEANIRENGLEARCRSLQGDLREHRRLLPPGAFDLVVSNPPYFPTGGDPARAELCCSLEALCAAAAFALRPGGDFALVHRPERLSSLLCALSGAGIEPKRLRFVSPTALSAPSLVLVEGRWGAKPGLHCLPPLVLKDSHGGPSRALCQIYHCEGGPPCPEPCTL